MILLIRLIFLACKLYTLVLMGRVVLDWMQLFNPGWRPRGALLVVANLCYALTDPPLRALRKVIPPLRIGPIALDTAFIVLFFIVLFLPRIILSFVY